VCRRADVTFAMLSGKIECSLACGVPEPPNLNQRPLLGNTMTFLARALTLPEELAGSYRLNPPQGRLDHLAKLNVFIGVNNSGKSRFLRELFKYRNWHFRVSDEAEGIFQAVAQRMTELRQKAEKIFSGVTLDSSKYLHEILTYKAPDIILENSRALDREIKLLAEASTPPSQPIDPYEGAFIRARRNLARDAKPYLETLMQLRNGLPEHYEFKRIYIPALRGMRSPRQERKFYLSRTIGDYFPQIKEYNQPPYTDASRLPLDGIDFATGVELYDEVRLHLLGDLEQRDTIARYQHFLGSTFFDGQEVALIPREGGDALYVKIGHEREQPIFHLGDGIQQIIIMTMPLFVHAKANLLLFLEEPENSLHPGLQRMLIDCLLAEGDPAGTRQIFISTHSHQFLDITLDTNQISVFKFQKQFEEGMDRDSVPAIVEGLGGP
jgi:hypothetical protein